MKVLFINPILDCQPVSSIGIASLSTYLKKEGHKVKLIVINEELNCPLNFEKIYEDCCKFSPDIIAFSSVNSQYEEVIGIAEYIKNKKDIHTIYGGPCPTVMPEKCLSNECIDFICIGEGEEALLEFVEKFEKNENLHNIQNIWSKQNGKIIKNTLRPLVDLKKIYPLDFSIFENMEEILKFRNGWFEFSLMRGCPFNCSHCQSAYIHNIYKKNYILRYAPIDLIVENLQNILKTYKNIKFFNFNDDTFNINKKFLTEFLDKYKNMIFKKHNIPFHVLCRVDVFDEETGKRLKEAGINIVKFGVESGSPRIRKQILKRNITDENIINAFKICDKYNIETWSFNMLGLPTETKEELYKTFKLNSKIKPNNFWLSIYYPIENTELYDFCVKNNLIKYDVLGKLKNYRTDSPLVSKYFKDGEIKLIYKISGWIINYYAFPKYRNMLNSLIEEVFKLWRQGTTTQIIDDFIKKNNQQLDNSLVAPFYSQKFKHIAIKIKKKG